MITVIGGSGFVGRNLTAELERRGLPHRAPGRAEPLDREPLGDVVYCAGVTGVFRERPLDTVDAHVGMLERVLRTGTVESLVYLSSTRVYHCSGTATEAGELTLDPADPDQIYEVSKAAGEALALGSGVPALVLRPCHIYGVDPGSANFLASIVEDAVRRGRVTLRSSLESSRAYVSVGDLVHALLALMAAGAGGVFNVAAPGNVTHGEIAARLTELTGCAVEVEPGSPTAVAPEIDTTRLRAAVDFRPESVLDALPRLVEGYRGALSAAPS